MDFSHWGRHLHLITMHWDLVVMMRHFTVGRDFWSYRIDRCSVAWRLTPNSQSSRLLPKSPIITQNLRINRRSLIRPRRTTPSHTHRLIIMIELLISQISNSKIRRIITFLSFNLHFQFLGLVVYRIINNFPVHISNSILSRRFSFITNEAKTTRSLGSFVDEDFGRE